LRRNCLLQRVIEGEIKGGIEMTGRWGRRRRKLLDDLKERRGYSHLKEETLDRTVWRARFGRGFGPVVRQTTEWMNIDVMLWLNRILYEHRWTEITWAVRPRNHLSFLTLLFENGLPLNSMQHNFHENCEVLHLIGVNRGLKPWTIYTTFKQRLDTRGSLLFK
jgi:hypothetical protein